MSISVGEIAKAGEFAMIEIWSVLNSQTLWSALSAIFTLIGASGICFAARQLKFNAWLRAQEVFTDEGFIELRSWLFERQYPWTEAEKPRAKEACRRFDEFAHLVPFLGLTPSGGKKLALKFWADPIATAWRTLEPIVTEERTLTRWHDKWKAFEVLGREAIVVAGSTLRQRRVSIRSAETQK